MKTIIAGDRRFNDPLILASMMIKVPFEVSTVICGLAKGADTLGLEWAVANHLPVMYFAANWASYGKAAGPIRNAQMAEVADALVAFMAEGSKGTASMVSLAKKKNLPIFLVHIKRHAVVDDDGFEVKIWWTVERWEYIGPLTRIDDGPLTGKNTTDQRPNEDVGEAE